MSKVLARGLDIDSNVCSLSGWAAFLRTHGMTSASCAQRVHAARAARMLPGFHMRRLYSYPYLLTYRFVSLLRTAPALFVLAAVRFCLFHLLNLSFTSLLNRVALGGVQALRGACRARF